MKKIDLLIIGYAATLIIDFVFLILVQRFDILLISGILALIPLIVTLNQRRKE
ncbi:MAG: hypothetical protein R3255_05225 [Candidatus Lokiarchaeia archaeon]|nr:hypothetical protein [Candidatus Lokiarchaeia archaeon]